MLLDLATYDRLINLIYDTPFAPASWSATLGAISAAFRAEKAVIFTFRHAPHDGGFAITHNLPQAQMEAWAAISSHEDPYVRALSNQQVVDGAVWVGSTLVRPSDLHATRMYRDIWKQIGIEHICFGVVFDGVDGHKLPTSISLFRGPQMPDFSAEETQLLQRIVMHLSRAMGVMFHLRDTDNRVAASQAALDRLSAGVALLDGEGRVIHHNRAAEALFALGDCFVLQAAPDGLRLALGAHVRGMNERFAAAMRDALAPVAQDPEHFSNGLVITDSAARPVCVMHASPVGASATPLPGEQARAIVFFYSLTDAPKLESEVLRQTFGLTPAEARAANAVLEGGSVREAADRLDISTNTLKSQLRAVYAKTSTNRQADLLKLLLALSTT